ncbi:GNAT family N-acetyltransferase [Spiribacter halobius]|uniref:GNAT family N-acetyltransferase n=1 Tax=Sediminicurvatus halobius TaxID=2182432 RepID=A0A2U2N8S8_9GAMM|nr:GNAT family N-acetyltransferase [Spiribacter halobius]PWG65508.1 GNAT family N-acetyltransferase [Spiribacter halobius]UEX76532.1 GNAT family N-acetyltransferase [Spiribacter halobius]
MQPRIIEGDWASLAPRARPLRIEVFVEEQGVPPELEWDEHDAISRHFLALAPDETVIGTGRLLPDGKVGRMAVARAWRGRGVGSALLEAIVDAARRDGHEALVLAAQLHALPFYANLGFEAFGEPFDEAGLPHRMMRRRLARRPAG